MADEQHLIRGGGRALVAGGVLFAVATVLHPSQETPASILDKEVQLVGSHAIYIVACLLILLGLPVLYGFDLRRVGRLGSTGFLVAWIGTALLAISSQFGFIAPALAATAPVTLDRVIAYPPVVVFNGIAAVAFMAGYVMLGMALSRSSAFSGWPGLLVGVGAPAHLIAAGVAQLAAPGLWFLAVLGAAALGAGLAWCGSRMAGASLLDAGGGAPKPRTPMWRGRGG
ncbi:MAG TPA: hypothetical protein VML96_10970 [Egibacteraceae bacterium]|nr:hypothetical protein [Egibacteraceae bacterium]